MSFSLVLEAARRTREREAPAEDFTTEGILEYDFQIPLTNNQRAMARVVDNRPLGSLCFLPEVREAFGIDDLLPDDDRLITTLFELISGVRTGKSQMSAAKCISATQTVNLDHLSHGEIARIPLVSRNKDLAQVNMNHILGNMENSPRLKKLLLQGGDSETILVRHPSGRTVEIKVTAGARAGATLIGRWLASCVFDEAPRMAAQDDGVVNLRDQLRAIRGRMVPGAVIMLIGSPDAPRGVAYDFFVEHFSKPSPACVVAVPHASTMNPSWWTPENIEALRKNDYEAYLTDVCGKFVDISGSIYSEDLIDECTRKFGTELPPEDGYHYVGAMDPATRKNSWTFGVFTKNPQGKIIQVFAREWKPGKGEKLSPKAVLTEVLPVYKMYRLQGLISDQHSFDAMEDIAYDLGINLIEHRWKKVNKDEKYFNLETRLKQGQVELAPHPEIKGDLSHVIRIGTPNGGYRVELLKNGKGRHADWAPVLALGVSEFLTPPNLDEEEEDPRDEQEKLEDEMHEAEREAMLDYDEVLMYLEGL